MSKPRFLQRAEVSRLLSEKGCSYIDEDGPRGNGKTYYPHAYWRTGNGFEFAVPLIGEDGGCYEHIIDEIFAELTKRSGS